MKKEKSSIIVYGMGKAYESVRFYIEETFDILAYSDKNWNKLNLERRGNVIPPDKIKDYLCDYIYISSEKYAEEIKRELEKNYGISPLKFLTIQDMWWYIGNQSIRDSWIISKLKEVPQGLTILDAGAGNMRYKPYCNHLAYISQDFGEYDDSKEEAGLQNRDWNSKKADKSVDVVLCSEVLEHLKDPNVALRELSRIIKKNGILLLTAPFCSLTHMAPYYYSNGFSRYWYEDNMKEVGFEIMEMIPYGNWFMYIAQELERFPYVAQRYTTTFDKDVTSKILEMVKILLDQSKIDEGSNELLCFGYLVKARRM